MSNTKPITKPFVSIDPPIVEDVLGRTLRSNNEFLQSIASSSEPHMFRYKKCKLYDNKHNPRKSMESMRKLSKKLRVKPVYWSKRKFKNTNQQKIDTMGIGLVIKPPVSQATTLANSMQNSPKRMRILEKPHKTRCSAVNIPIEQPNKYLAHYYKKSMLANMKNLSMK